MKNKIKLLCIYDAVSSVHCFLAEPPTDRPNGGLAPGSGALSDKAIKTGAGAAATAAGGMLMESPGVDPGQGVPQVAPAPCWRCGTDRKLVAAQGKWVSRLSK